MRASKFLRGSGRRGLKARFEPAPGRCLSPLGQIAFATIQKRTDRRGEPMTDDRSRYLYPEQIVSTAWLAAHLDDLDLRIFDCTTYLIYETATERPYRVESGRADFDAGRIPGSAFIDLQEELSDKSAKTNFMMLPVE